MTDNMKPVRCGCGGEACVDYFIGEPSEGASYVVFCRECEIQTMPYDTEAEAITAWNRAMGVDKVDELMEHVWREKLDTRDKIADLVERMLR